MYQLLNYTILSREVDPIVYEIGAILPKLVGSFLSIDNSLPTLPFRLYLKIQASPHLPVSPSFYP